MEDVTITIIESASEALTKEAIEAVLTGIITSHTHNYTDLEEIPAAFPPEAHNHLVADITDFPSTMPPSLHSHGPGDITQDVNNRFVTDAEKQAWSAKQPAGSYLVAADISSKADLVAGTVPTNQLPSTMPPAAHTHPATAVTADAFQTPVFANPLALDASSHKDFKPGLVTGATTVNLTGAVDGDAGMIELIMNNVGGYAVTLGTMFTKNISGTTIDTAANKDNIISWRKIATDIIYSISQVQ